MAKRKKSRATGGGGAPEEEELGTFIDPDDLPSELGGPYRDLLASAGSRKGEMRKCIQWVMENLLVPVEQIDPKTVPGRLAVTYLHWAQSDPDHRKDFMTKFGLKMIPRDVSGDGSGSGLETDVSNELLLKEWENNGEPPDAFLPPCAEDVG